MGNISKLQVIINQIRKLQNDLYHNNALHCGLSDSALWILYAVYIYLKISACRTVYAMSRCIPDKRRIPPPTTYCKSDISYLKGLPVLTIRKLLA